MSDTEPSGAATNAAETASAPSTKLPGAFSNSRGSGLARGKRPTGPSPKGASAAPAIDYKPTAVSILTAPTEFKNPFAPPATAAPPAEAAAVSAPAPAPEPVPAPLAPEVPAAEASATPIVPVPENPPQASAPPPAEAAAAEPKAELNILPPETPRRVEHSWESESFRDVASQPATDSGRPAEPPFRDQRPRREDRRGDRPYFRSERENRDGRPPESREPRASFTPPERTFDRGRPQNESAPASAPAEAKKNGGMFGWVKKLLGGSPAEAPKPEARPGAPGDRDYNSNGPYRRRRHRGGRNRHFQGDQRGPREGQPGGQPPGDQRGYGGEHRHHDHSRHHHHGGGGFHDRGPENGPPRTGS